MNIKDVAKQVNLSAKQIRDYEKYGLLDTVSRSASGYRLYGEQEIKRLTFIQHAREVGFSLQQIEQLLALQDDKNRSNADVKALTRQHIDDLNQKIERLQAMKATLQSWHDCCAGDGSSHCSILDGLMTGQEVTAKA